MKPLISEIVKDKYYILKCLTPEGCFCGAVEETKGHKISNFLTTETSLVGPGVLIYSSGLSAGRSFHVMAATWLQLSRADFIKNLCLSFSLRTQVSATVDPVGVGESRGWEGVGDFRVRVGAGDGWGWM